MDRRLGLKAALLGLLAAWAGPAMAQNAEAPARRGGTLTYAVGAEPPSYDCHAVSTFAVLHRVSPHYSTLLRFRPGAYPELEGDAAESWTVSPDNLTYTFRLRPNIVFHDGTPFTSEDVRATYERLRNPPQGITSVRKPSFEKIAAIETPDPRTVVFRMREIDASVVTGVFASPWNCLYSAARLAQDPNFPARNVMGTGPFRFVEHVAGSHWVGERFDRYFRENRPYLDGFRAVTMGSAATLNALEGRQIHAEFRGFSPPERDRVVRRLGQEASVQESPWLLHMDISFNAQRKPFDDPRVRRALSLAIDRWGASRSLGRISLMRHVGGVMLPGGEWAATEAELTALPGYGRDMAANRAEARRLLREAGQENLTFTLIDRNIEPYIATGIFLIDQWRQIGVRVEHRQLELSGYFNALFGANFDAIVDSYTDYTDDPTTGLIKFLSNDVAPVASGRFEDRELHDLYARQGRTVDRTERRNLIRAFERRVMEQAYSVPILWWHRTVVTSNRVRGWTMSPSHMIYQSLEDVWLAGD